MLPAAFFGHGSPMNALEDNRYTATWAAFGASVPAPRAILCISAHWFIQAAALTAMAEPRTIHDFYGFPDELFAVEYPAPGAPAIAAEIADVAAPIWLGLDADSWGIDHGTWSVLVHAFPAADVPVLQLSVDALKSIDDHLALAAALAPLREAGILVVGSGNVVHNLRRADFRAGETGEPWAHRFDDAAREVLTTDPASIGRLAGHPDYTSAVPTPEHFLPVVYLAGLAAAAGSTCDVLVDGYLAGSLSMTSYGLDVDIVPQTGAAATTTTPPDAPPESSNL